MATTILSNGGNVTVNTPSTIINGILPSSLKWTNDFTTYYIYNSLTHPILLANNFTYYNLDGQIINEIPALAHIQLVIDSGGNWHDQAGLDTSIPEQPTNGTITLPIATSETLGVIKGGTNIEIDPDGTINAINGSQVQSDWNEADNTQPDYIKNKPSTSAQVQSDWNEADNSQPDFIKNKPTIPSAQVPSDWNSSSGVSRILNKPTIPAQVNIIAGTNVAVTGTYPNITVSATGTGGGATSLPTASSLGILDNGTDQTSALNAIFTNAAYAGIIMDFTAPGAVTISGTVNCQGKTISFVPGSYFTGTGILSNVYISAGYRQKIFDITVSLSGSYTHTQYFSALWYGTPTNGTNSQPALQKTIDTAIANQTTFKNIFFPEATYTLTGPLIIQNYNGTYYDQCSISLIGESSFWNRSGSGSHLYCTFKNTFCIGMQAVKGVEIKNMFIQGTWTNPTLTLNQFYNISFAAYTDPACRDDRYSPYTGIVIDPFGASLPLTGGGYPGLSAYYKGSSYSGSTGVVIEDVQISNFCVGIATSVNGQTANAELMYWSKIHVDNCKLAISGGQAQEKLNTVIQTACWGNTHTFFSTSDYGQGTPGNWYIKGVNIAGNVQRLVNRTSNYYFPLYISDVYAEGLGTIGNWLGNDGDLLENSTIDFANLADSALPNAVLVGNLKIVNSQIRYYSNSGTRVPFAGVFVFENVYFDSPPFVYSDQSAISNYQGNGNVTYRNCTIGAANIQLGRVNDKLDNASNMSRNFCYGNYRLLDVGGLYQGREYGIEVKYFDPVARIKINPSSTACSVSISANVATVTPPSAFDLNRVFIGAFIIHSNQYVFGVVSAIDSTTFTVSYVPNGLTSGSYVLNALFDLMIISFMGSTTSGSPNITNVVLDKGSFPEFLAKHGSVRIPGFYDSASQEGVMLSYDSGTATIVMDRNCATTASNIYFSNTNQKKFFDVRGTNPLPNSEIMPRGSYYSTIDVTNGNILYIVKTTGYFSGSPTATYNQIN